MKRTRSSNAAERRPASLVVVEVIKKKFIRKAEAAALRTEVLVGETPELPIPRSGAGPGLLADTIVKRWQEHQPLHRLESTYARDGIELNRSTLCTWHAQLAELVEPLVEMLHRDALTQPYLCTDATGVLVQYPQRCKRGHFWVLVAPAMACGSACAPWRRSGRLLATGAYNVMLRREGCAVNQ